MSQLPNRAAETAKLGASAATGIRASVRSIIISVALGAVKVISGVVGNSNADRRFDRFQCDADRRLAPSQRFAHIGCRLHWYFDCTHWWGGLRASRRLGGTICGRGDFYQRCRATAKSLG